MRVIKVLSVCGSGTVSSSMVAAKMKDQLGEYGYRISAEEVNPGGVSMALESGNYDFIAHTSPVHGDINIPVINAIGFLTGFGEEEFIEEALKVIREIEEREK